MLIPVLLVLFSLLWQGSSKVITQQQLDKREKKQFEKIVKHSNWQVAFYLRDEKVGWGYVQLKYYLNDSTQVTAYQITSFETGLGGNYHVLFPPSKFKEENFFPDSISASFTRIENCKPDSLFLVYSPFWYSILGRRAAWHIWTKDGEWYYFTETEKFVRLKDLLEHEKGVQRK